MKQLTIEQKAQRYDEALKRAKNTIEVNQTIPDIVECVESLFPELKESEDERIRKELIEQVVYIVPNNDEVDSEGNVLSTYQKRIDKYRAWLEKQGGQKPVEWSEEDKVILNNIIWGVHMKSIKPLDEMEDRSKYKKYEDFLKSLPARFSLQPKAEWSEEDSMHLTNAIIAAEKEWGSESSTSKWLKSLKSQKEEQTEWDGTEIAPPIDSDVCG